MKDIPDADILAFASAGCNAAEIADYAGMTPVEAAIALDEAAARQVWHYQKRWPE